MELDPEKSKADAVYKLLIGCVVPRPIAWVSTIDADGVKNVAPFSYSHIHEIFEMKRPVEHYRG